MTDLVLWGGPVYAPGATPAQYPNGDIADVVFYRDTRIVTINQGIGGFGSSHFSALGAEYKARGGGSVLQGLLAAHGLSRDMFDSIGCAGFSAWHGLLSQLLLTDGWDIRCSVMLDACFSAVDPGTWQKPGFVAYGERAARNEALCCYTSSNGGGPGGQYPSSTGAECAGANFSASVSAAGAAAEPAPIYGGVPEPVSALRAGSLYWYDFQGRARHDQQAHDLLLPTLQAFLPPGLASLLPIDGAGGDADGGGSGEGEAADGALSTGAKATLFLGAAATALYGAWRLRKARAR